MMATKPVQFDAMQSNKLLLAKKQQKVESVPYVYAMRGWLGIFSTGMDKLSEDVQNKLGYPAISLSYYEENKLVEHFIKMKKEGKKIAPIILIGHSLGADKQIEVAKKLDKAGIPVELLIPIDNTASNNIPANVKNVYYINLGKSRISNLLLGWGSQLSVDSSKTKFNDVNLNNNDRFDNINHGNMDDSKQVLDYLIEIIQTHSEHSN